MRVQIKPTHQIQRINSLLNQLDELNKINPEAFMKRPHQKVWSGAEVLKHMIMAHAAYAAKIDGALGKLNSVKDEVEALPTRAIPSFLIKRFPPKEGEIRFKMKTTKSFKPVLEVDKLSKEHVQELLDKMKETLHQLSGWVEQTRKKDVLPVRFNSAIGAIVKFNASEACEFILCHNERHFQQVKNTIGEVDH
ncbi:MAG: hypothetical protein P8P74_05765 [Crocinitomicaceae bacterium]|nr:hypothetical protein [Crocinitomicaceae bacterium]